MTWFDFSGDSTLAALETSSIQTGKSAADLVEEISASGANRKAQTDASHVWKRPGGTDNGRNMGP